MYLFVIFFEVSIPSIARKMSDSIAIARRLAWRSSSVSGVGGGPIAFLKSSNVKGWTGKSSFGYWVSEGSSNIIMRRPEACRI